MGMVIRQTLVAVFMGWDYFSLDHLILSAWNFFFCWVYCSWYWEVGPEFMRRAADACVVLLSSLKKLQLESLGDWKKEQRDLLELLEKPFEVPLARLSEKIRLNKKINKEHYDLENYEAASTAITLAQVYFMGIIWFFRKSLRCSAKVKSFQKTTVIFLNKFLKSCPNKSNRYYLANFCAKNGLYCFRYVEAFSILLHPVNIFFYWTGYESTSKKSKIQRSEKQSHPNILSFN